MDYSGNDLVSANDHLLPCETSEHQSTHYEVLGVAHSATSSEIRDVYLRLKQTYVVECPALYSLMSEDEAGAAIAAVEEAFRVLSDSKRRAEYDKQIGVSSTRSKPGASTVEDHFDPCAQLQQERLALLRSGAALDPEGDEGLLISVAVMDRPRIPRIANNSNSSEMQDKYLDLIEKGDLSDGFLYKELREAAGVNEDEIQERTKISIEYIHSIENNRLERLPPGVYVRGFLRSYFRYLNVPGYDELVKAFSDRYEDWCLRKKSKS